MYATGIGSLPGSDLPGSLRSVLAGFDHAWLPELPARGAGAAMVGRTLAMTQGLGVDLQPQGWRVGGSSGVDHARAVALLRRDLDDLEEAAQGYAGCVTLTLAGPWTLAAQVERRQGDKLLADHGARRDLAQSLADGVATLLDELHRRLPEVSWRAQLDEPMLPAVMVGAVPTASGFSRLPTIDRPEASAMLQECTRAWVGRVEAVRLHCCAPGLELDLMALSGIDELALDVGTLGTRDLDAMAQWLESGRGLLLGLVDTASVDAVAKPDQIVRRALDLLRPLALDPALLEERLAITTACGLADWSRPAASQQLEAMLEAVPLLGEQLQR